MNRGPAGAVGVIVPASVALMTHAADGDPIPGDRVVGCWPFDGGTQARDVSGNDRHGTLCRAGRSFA